MTFVSVRRERRIIAVYSTTETAYPVAAIKTGHPPPARYLAVVKNTPLTFEVSRKLKKARKTGEKYAKDSSVKCNIRKLRYLETRLSKFAFARFLI